MKKEKENINLHERETQNRKEVESIWSSTLIRLKSFAGVC